MTSHNYTPDEYQRIGEAILGAMRSNHPVTDGISIYIDDADGTIEIKRARDGANPLIYRNDQVEHNGRHFYLGHLRNRMDLDIVIELDNQRLDWRPQEFFSAHQMRYQQKHGADFIVPEDVYID